MLTKSKTCASFIRYFTQYSKMVQGLPLDEVVQKLEAFAPLRYAEKWDNVGLLLEPCSRSPIEKILLTNDLTERVMQEALDKNVNMIISYHPPIFAPLKRITQRTWKERIVSKCLTKSIALYSPHTAWDSAPGGVNDWLASALPYDNIMPIKQLDNSDDSNVGSGRTLTTNISLENAISAVQEHIGLDVHVSVATSHTLNSVIKQVAVCAGSGASLLSGGEADLYITGEMSHHEVLDANHKNVSIILCNHSNSERGFLLTFKAKLKDLLKGECTIMVSETDEDPIKTFVKRD